MRPFKSLLVLTLFSMAFNSYSADSFEFDPQSHTAHFDTSHIWFSNSSNVKTGPELFADETNADFFDLVKTLTSNAVADYKKLNLLYEAANSQSHGQYNRIIPDF